jgi:hypothetical protein
MTGRASCLSTGGQRDSIFADACCAALRSSTLCCIERMVSAALRKAALALAAGILQNVRMLHDFSQQSRLHPERKDACHCKADAQAAELERQNQAVGGDTTCVPFVTQPLPSLCHWTAQTAAMRPCQRACLSYSQCATKSAVATSTTSTVWVYTQPLVSRTSARGLLGKARLDAAFGVTNLPLKDQQLCSR